MNKYNNSKFSRIKTPRLILREWKLMDIDDAVESLNNPNVAPYTLTPYPYTAKDAEKYINENILNPNNLKEAYFAIQNKKDGKVIGGAGVKVKKNGAGDAVVWLNEKYQGQGFGVETWRAITAFAFGVLGVDRMESSFAENNNASWNMQQKIGFKLADKKVDFKLPNGEKLVETILKKEDFKE